MNKSFLLLMLASTALSAQNFSKQDTLKGSNTVYRNFWDVKKYEIDVEPNIKNKSASGTNKITFEITKKHHESSFPDLFTATDAVQNY